MKFLRKALRTEWFAWLVLAALCLWYYAAVYRPRKIACDARHGMLVTTTGLSTGPVCAKLAY